ncbi:MAG: hypothetical protein AAFR64_11005 [Pseudomonadota bacterium]
MGDSRNLPHPHVPEWLSEPTWLEDGQFAVWTTVDDTGPFQIVHNRDFMMNGEQVEQDYNFIDYLFGETKEPIVARMYLDETDAVTVSTAGKSDSIPDGVLLYLKKRFREVHVLGEHGSVKVWPK